MQNGIQNVTTLERRSDGWWIVWGDTDDPNAGPYDTMREAQDDKRGIARFMREYAKTVQHVTGACDSAIVQ